MPEGKRFRVRLANRGGRSIEVSAGAPLLEQLEKAGEALPYGCRHGVCTGCTARLIDGAVEQPQGGTLNPTDIAAGYRLLCVGRALSDCVLDVGEDCRKGLTTKPLEGPF